MIVRCLFSIFFVIIVVFGKPAKIDRNFMKNEDDITTCGYDSCHPIKPGMLNVHLVPHTHDDVGWLKTVDQYFYGSKSNIQKAGVQYILDSVIQELLRDPNKRFIYVETAYLWKWWKKQHDTLRHQVKKLINRGQLEIIGGGWAMNDEAVTHYQSIIDQFTWGLRKLNETFGDCGRPRVGWQIDPFGHSREMASLFAQMGYDGLLFGRLDYQDKRQRLKTLTAEMVWQGSANLGNASQLFTSVLYNNYMPPPGFCFDVLCDDEPIIDDKRSTEYNVDRKVAAISYFAKEQAKYYASNNVIFTMGGDFTYMDAHMWFKNMDKLISHTNALQTNGSKVNLLYSTPSCYLKAVYEENENRKWPVKSDDFFPYASDPNSYWTGYFTSRPTLKRFERVGNNFLQVCKQLYSITDLGPEDWVDLNALREAMGVMQHHDAITGTEKEHVAHDYARLLSKGFEECDIITNTALNKLMIKTKDDDTAPGPKLPLQSCLHLNISQCDVTENNEYFIVTLYNPLSRPISRYVRLPITEGKTYSVIDPDGTELIVQLTPIPDNVLRIPGRVSSATIELMFHASEIPPLGFKSYYVYLRNREDTTLQEDLTDKFNLNVGHIVLNFKENGLLSKIKLKNTDINIEQDFLWYQGAAGNNREAQNRSSGAYIFRPNGTAAYKISDNIKTKTFKGPLTQEIHQTYNDWVSQIIRIYEQELYVEYEWLVGPIPVDDHLGKEIISRFTSELKTEGTFYTDSNGREMLKRTRNYRPTWKVDLNESIAGNYYPVTSKIVINDEKQNLQFAVLTDRAQGGASLKDGEVELMVHRRLLHDDAFGVDEALNEKAFGKGLVARGHHYLIGGPYINASHDNIVIQEKDLAQRKLLDAWTFVTPIKPMTYNKYKSWYNMQYSGLKAALPKNIQILTLEPWKAYTFLLRLEHVFEKNDDPIMSQPVTIDIKNIFAPFALKSARETTLGGNQWLEDNERLPWKAGEKLENYVNQPDFFDVESDYNNNNETNEVQSDEPYNEDVDNRIIKELDRLNPFMYTFNPMQIRTFVVEIDKM